MDFNRRTRRHSKGKLVNLSPPPIKTTILDKSLSMLQPWQRWFSDLYDRINGIESVAAGQSAMNDQQITLHENLKTTAHGDLVSSSDPRLTGPREPLPHGFLSAYHSDTTFGSANNGSLIIGDGTHWRGLPAQAPDLLNKSVLAIDSGETVPSWKSVLSDDLPSDIYAGSVGYSGASLIFSRIDHVHPTPTTWPFEIHEIASALYHSSSILTAGYLPYWNGTILANTPLWTNATNMVMGAAATTGGKLEILSTTEQLRLDYSAAVYSSFTVDSSGYLSIIPTGNRLGVGGTPSGTLHVQAANCVSYFQSSTTTNAVRLYLWNNHTAGIVLQNDANTGIVVTGALANSLLIGQQDVLPVQIYTNINVVMTIAGDAKVGIGAIHPDAFLEIYGHTEQLRLTWTDASVYASFTLDVSGNLTIAPTGTVTNITGSLATTTTLSCTTAKCSNLTDGYLPYHVSDAAGLANTGLYYDGTNYAIGFTSPAVKLHLYQDANSLLTFKIQNNHAGASALAAINMENSSGGGNFWFFQTSPAYTGGGGLNTGEAALMLCYGNAAGMHIFTNDATDLVLGINNSAALTIGAATGTIGIWRAPTAGIAVDISGVVRTNNYIGCGSACPSPVPCTIAAIEDYNGQIGLLFDNRNNGNNAYAEVDISYNNNATSLRLSQISPGWSAAPLGLLQADSSIIRSLAAAHGLHIYTQGAHAITFGINNTGNGANDAALDISSTKIFTFYHDNLITANMTLTVDGSGNATFAPSGNTVFVSGTNTGIKINSADGDYFGYLQFQHTSADKWAIALDRTTPAWGGVVDDLVFYDYTNAVPRLILQASGGAMVLTHENDAAKTLTITVDGSGYATLNASGNRVYVGATDDVYIPNIKAAAGKTNYVTVDENGKLTKGAEL